MNFKELLLNIAETLIALLPLFFGVFAFLKNHKKQVNGDIDVIKKDNNNNKNVIIKEIEAKFRTLTYQNDSNNEKTVVRVEEYLEKSDQVLKNYSDQIIESNKRQELLMNVTKSFMDVIIETLKLDSKHIYDNTYSKVSNKFNLTKEQLENYPELLESDIDLLKVTFKKLFENIGYDNFNKMLEEIGYEKEKAKEQKL